MREKFLSAALATLAIVSVGIQAADPVPASDRPVVPRIVASPEAPKPAAPVGQPMPLDVGKFIFLITEGATGPVSYDFSAPGVVMLLPDPPKDAVIPTVYPGIKQGEAIPAWHPIPSKTAVPCLGVAEGTVKISAWGVADGRAKKLAELTVQVGPRPPPVPPTPPVPPEPVPSANPFSNQFGLHVLIIEETKDRAKLTAGQRAVMFGETFRSMLETKCGIGADGKTRTYRIWDQNVDATGDAEVWKKALARPRTGVPWLMIGNGTKGYEGPLPATLEETTALITKIGG